MEKRAILVIIAFLLYSAAMVSATALSDKAAQVQPGMWSEFTGTSFPTSLISTGTDNILNYANSAVWDSIKGEVRMVGQGHNEAERMIIYDEATNVWRNNTPPGNGGIGHGYDHNAIDPATGVNYYRYYNGTAIRKFTNGAWSSAPSLPSSPTICGSLEYFPEMNALIFTGGNVCYKLQGSAWSQVTGTALSFGPYHSVSEYSTSAKAVFFGGGNGSKVIYKLAGNGQITRMADAPVVAGVPNGENAPLTADPVSGELIILALDGKMYAYSPAADEWRTLAQTLPSLGVTVPISTYGVIMVLRPGKVYLYKHAPASATITGIRLAGTGARIDAWPNPARGGVWLRSTGLGWTTGFRIYDILGREVSVFGPGNNAQSDGVFFWNAAALPAGEYMVKADREGGTLSRRIVITK